MTEPCFRSQIARLRSTFGERSMPESRVELIYRESRYVTDLDFENMVDKFISTLRSAPLPSDFRESVKEISKNASKTRWTLGEIKPEQMAFCKDCGDSGFVRLVRLKEHEEWAKWESGSAPCHCIRGRDLIDAGRRHKPTPWDFGPQYNENWKKSYAIVSTYGGKE